MTTKTWVGGTGSFNDPNDWSPTGTPGPGDIAIIQAGTAIAQEQKLDGFELQLQGPASVLDISDVVFGANFVLSAPPGAGGAAALNAIGFNANHGLIEVGPSPEFYEFVPPFTITLRDQAPSPGCPRAAAVFVNDGTIQLDSGQPFAIKGASADAVLINNGLMDFRAGFAQAEIGVSVLGNGTIDSGRQVMPAGSALLLAFVPHVEFGSTVGAGESLVIDGSAFVRLDQPSRFHAVIHGFVPLPVSSPPNLYTSFFEPEIILANTQVTTYSVADDVLSLWNGSAMVAQLHFADFAYAKANFLVSSSGSSTIIEPQGTLTPIGMSSIHAPDHVFG